MGTGVCGFLALDLSIIDWSVSVAVPLVIRTCSSFAVFVAAVALGGVGLGFVSVKKDERARRTRRTIQIPPNMLALPNSYSPTITRSHTTSQEPRRMHRSFLQVDERLCVCNSSRPTENISSLSSSHELGSLDA